MDLLSLSTTITKIGDLLEQIIRVKKGFRSHRALRHLVRAYMRLEAVLEANEGINRTLDMFVKFKDLTSRKADFAMLDFLLSELQYHIQSAMANLSKFSVEVMESREIIEILYEDIESEKTKRSPQIKIALANAAQFRALKRVSAQIAGEMEKLQIRRKTDGQLPVLQLFIQPLTMKEDARTITVDLNKEGYTKELENAIDEFINRESLSHLVQAKSQIKKIIQDHWQTEDILDAMDSEARLSSDS
jgi:hypothetical protein